LNCKASAEGREFRTAPLMGMGRMGAPFLHDARVYLSKLTVNTAPAGTGTSNHNVTNAPWWFARSTTPFLQPSNCTICRHRTTGTSRAIGSGCPVPPHHSDTNIDYGTSPADVICPPHDSAVSKTNRSDSREVIQLPCFKPGGPAGADRVPQAVVKDRHVAGGGDGITCDLSFRESLADSV